MRDWNVRMDIMGVGVRLAIPEYLAENMGPSFEPPAILCDLVAAGHLGRPRVLHLVIVPAWGGMSTGLYRAVDDSP